VRFVIRGIRESDGATILTNVFGVDESHALRIAAISGLRDVVVESVQGRPRGLGGVRLPTERDQGDRRQGGGAA
jgi:hypothetical protein